MKVEDSYFLTNQVSYNTSVGAFVQASDSVFNNSLVQKNSIKSGSTGTSITIQIMASNVDFYGLKFSDNTVVKNAAGI